MKKNEKRQNRVKTLESLYEMEFQEQSAVPRNSNSKAKAVQSHKLEIDRLISKHSQNWKISRMALLDLNILRIAVYEILFSETKESPKIFINEAVDLAKAYGGADSSKFINGILDSIAKTEERQQQ